MRSFFQQALGRTNPCRVAAQSAYSTSTVHVVRDRSSDKACHNTPRNSAIGHFLAKRELTSGYTTVRVEKAYVACSNISASYYSTR